MAKRTVDDSKAEMFDAIRDFFLGLATALKIAEEFLKLAGEEEMAKRQRSQH